uniref:Uncharacterized protein n=1 Tax=Oryza glumipatula TaxID=40148 RepID=A0A0E0BGA6_9ORYZ
MSACPIRSCDMEEEPQMPEMVTLLTRDGKEKDGRMKEDGNDMWVPRADEEMDGKCDENFFSLHASLASNQESFTSN